jgi:hypothetical protein
MVEKAINCVVSRVKGFQEPKSTTTIERVRMFSDRLLVRRIDRNALSQATKKHDLPAQPRPRQHVLINSMSYTRYALQIDREQPYVPHIDAKCRVESMCSSSTRYRALALTHTYIHTVYTLPFVDCQNRTCSDHLD